MGAREITTKYRMSQWLNILQDHSAEETVKAFCVRRGIKKDHYYYWLRKIREAFGEEYLNQKQPQTGLSVQGFTEVRITEPLEQRRASVNGQISIESNSCKITADAGYPVETLVVLIRELKRP